MEKNISGYKYYLSGLKGLACLLIMLGHFIGIYNYAEQFWAIPQLDIMLHSRFSFLVNETYWLYMFFVISGYLVAKSVVNSKRDIVLKVINRLFRLGFPILFAYLVIYIIYLVVGFHSVETSKIFKCAWYQGYFLDDYTLKDVLIGPVNVLIFGNATLNGPYWVLRYMFIASTIIYFLKYIFQMLSYDGYDAICFTLLVVITLGSYCVSPIITACLMGMVISFYEDEKDIFNKPYCAFWTMVIAMSIYVLSEVLLASVFFCTLIIFIPRVKCVENIFSSKLFQLLGDISWGVYSFHWPVMCSVGALSILSMAQTIGLKKAYVASFVVDLVITLALSIGFFYSFEKLATWLTKMLSGRLKQLIYGNDK